MVTEPGAVPRDRFLAPIGATALLRAAAKTATFPLLRPSMGISRRKQWVSWVEQSEGDGDEEFYCSPCFHGKSDESDDSNNYDKDVNQPL